MCGVFFTYEASSPSDVRELKAHRALKELRHRGPDSQGVLHGRGFSIGHTRLSIIDLSGSSQPMQCPEKRYILSFNGEIYNYQDLRDNLKYSWQFKTSGDTEVLLAGLILKGIDFLASINGMFAFAFWDCLTNKLLVARDTLGKKPLFFFESGENFFCASELPALKVLLPSKPEESLPHTLDYFRFGYQLPGNTIYKNIKEVLPGHYLSWSPNAKSQTHAFNSPFLAEATYNQKSIKETSEQIRTLLSQSIDYRLVSDVEVGAFLSGGVDSSILVSILAKKIPNQLKTFSIGFKDSGYDESRYSKLISSKFKTNHYSKNFEIEDAIPISDLIQVSIGQPFSDSSILPFVLLTNFAAQEVKVALSGDGADEAFAGYQRYQARRMLAIYAHAPKPLRRLINHLVCCLKEPKVHHSKSLIKKAKLFLDIANENPGSYFCPPVFSAEVFSRILPGVSFTPPTENLNITLPSNSDSVMEMMRRDIQVYLPQDILAKADRGSMYSSLEVRSPFLDVHILRYALAFKSGSHFGLFSGKRLLREAFKADIPKEIFQRRKQGFSVPLGNWFQKCLGGELTELMSCVDSPLELNEVKNLIKTNSSGQRDYGIQLWNIYCYFKWKSLGL